MLSSVSVLGICSLVLCRWYLLDGSSFKIYDCPSYLKKELFCWFGIGLHLNMCTQLLGLMHRPVSLVLNFFILYSLKAAN